MQIKRRFIAGAVCPRCALMDRIVMVWEAQDTAEPLENATQYRECVSCGFKEKLVSDESTRELETRVSREKKPEPTVQVIKFYPNPNKSK
jgi:uncharacterized protein